MADARSIASTWYSPESKYLRTASGLKSRPVRSPQAQARAARHAPVPFATQRRHQFWTVDIRYLDMVTLPSNEMPYCISIIDNYRRAIVASTISPRQNLNAFLMLLYVAVRQHGAPDA